MTLILIISKNDADDDDDNDKPSFLAKMLQDKRSDFALDNNAISTYLVMVHIYYI